MAKGASASVCALVVGVVLAQYIFTLKRRTELKIKIVKVMEPFKQFPGVYFFLVEPVLL